MGKPIDITRLDLFAEELRKLASKAQDGRVVRRLLGISLLLEGKSREEAATASGMDRQTLRDWVHRYNAEGVAGLYPRSSPGRPSRLSEAQMAELRTLVVDGPDPEKDGVVRWRCVDLRTAIIDRFDVTVHERTVGKLLSRLRLTRLQPRPYHPKKDPEAETAFKKTSRAW
jgi:transposase